MQEERSNLSVFHQKDSNGIANSEDPDQTAPLGAVSSGSALFAQTCPKTLDHYSISDLGTRNSAQFGQLETMVLIRFIIMLTSLCKYPLTSPLLYSETRVYRGLHYFLIFALIHRLWVLVRTASLTEVVLTCTQILCFQQKLKNNAFFHLKIIMVFTAVKNRCMLHGQVLWWSSSLSVPLFFMWKSGFPMSYASHNNCKNLICKLQQLEVIRGTSWENRSS